MSDIFLLLGPEKGKKQQYLKETIQKIAQKVGSAPEIHRFYPFESDMDAILDIAGSGSLFSAHLIIIVNQAETIKAKDAKLFSEYCENPNENATFIFISDETSSAKISNYIVKKVAKQNSVIFWELFESDKRSWLLHFFRTADLAITPEGVEYLLEMLENNTAEFQNVCRQIAIFYPSGSQLSVESLESFLYHSREETVFSLFERITEGDFQSALDTLRKISLGGTVYYPQLVGGLLWQLKRLSRWSDLANQNYSPNEIAKTLKIFGKRAIRQYQQAVAKYQNEELKQMLILTTRMDSLLRESRTELQLTLTELYLYFLVVKKGDSSSFERALSLYL